MEEIKPDTVTGGGDGMAGGTEIEDRSGEFARAKRQGVHIAVVSSLLILIGAILSLANVVLYVGPGVEERPFYTAGMGYFLLMFGLVGILTGCAMYLYYGQKLREAAVA